MRRTLKQYRWGRGKTITSREGGMGVDAGRQYVPENRIDRIEGGSARTSLMEAQGLVRGASITIEILFGRSFLLFSGWAFIDTCTKSFSALLQVGTHTFPACITADKASNLGIVNTVISFFGSLSKLTAAVLFLHL